jgi:hypothetical protein
VLHSAVVQGRITEVLDMEAIMAAASALQAAAGEPQESLVVDRGEP